MNKVIRYGSKNKRAACSCGASAGGRHSVPRFLRRHPSLCSERREFSKQLASGTRSVEDHERREVEY